MLTRVPSLIVPIVLPLTILPQASASSLLWYNATSDAGRVECIYQISGQYALLQRILYYALLLFAVIGKECSWLVAGALGAAMTFAASAALHVIILAGISSDSILDLDSLGVFAIVSVGALIATVFFDYSQLLRESPARPVFRYWALVMIVGTVCSVIALWRDYPSEDACVSLPGSHGTETGTEPVLLTSTAQLGLARFNCTYACFERRQLFRTPGQILAVPAGTVSTARNKLLLASTFLTLIFGTLVSAYRLINTHRFHTKYELHQAQQTSRDILNSNILSGKYRRAERHIEESTRRQLSEGQQPYQAGWVTNLLSVVCVVVLVLNEIFIHTGIAIPTGEESFAVGQWGPWVAVIMALAGSAIVEYHRPEYEKRQKILRDEGVYAESDVPLSDGTGGVQRPKPTWQERWSKWPGHVPRSRGVEDRAGRL
ncbi:hypothetical protein BJX99DRAFT_259393 [Aspergillus californicus]